jgi:hypothetical protein
VHNLSPSCTSSMLNLVIIFFHGFTFGQNDEWKTTRTTKETNAMYWPHNGCPKTWTEKFKFSLSYNASFHGVHNNVIEIGRNFIQSLMDSRE